MPTRILACIVAGSALVLAQSPSDTVSPRAKQLHERAIVIDSHDDTTQRLLFEKGFDIGVRHANGNIDIPRMKEGGLDALFFSIWVPSDLTGPPAVKRAMDLIDAVREAARTHPNDLMLATTAGGPVRSLGTQNEKNNASRPPSFMRGMSMFPLAWRTPMSNPFSNRSRCVVSSCESMTIARSCSCFARGETVSDGDCARTRAEPATMQAKMRVVMGASYIARVARLKARATTGGALLDGIEAWAV